jgi:hypothetical protein
MSVLQGLGNNVLWCDEKNDHHRIIERSWK